LKKTRWQLSYAAYAAVKKGRSAGQALWPAAKAFGQKTRRVALMLQTPIARCRRSVSFSQLSFQKSSGGVPEDDGRISGIYFILMS